MKIPLIYNIQRYSLQDGPGFRTTIFLKGCPLRCPWCHNPDSQDPEKQILLDMDKCTGCGACIQVCSNGACRQEGESIIFERSLCIKCGRCVEACPASAREMCGKEISEEEIVREAQKDEMFYQSSNGGVTIGGGDPLYFPEYTMDLAQRLKHEMLHVAIDTAAFCDWSYLDEVRRFADLFLIDLKTMDSDKYKNVIGANLAVVQKNIEMLADAGASVRVRIPVIPGFNDTEADFAAFSAYLGTIRNRLEGIDILPFHSYAAKKYRLSGKWDQYLFQETESLQPEDVKGLAICLKNAGFSMANSRLTIGGLT